MKYVFKRRFYRWVACLFDVSGYLFLKPKRNTPSSLKTLPRILISRLDHLGDVILASGIPKIIKDRYPQSRVTFLVSSATTAVLQGNPWVDEVLVWDAPWFRRRGSKKKKTDTVRGLIKTLKTKKLDAVLGLRGDLRENFIFWRAGVPIRVGYGITGGGFFLTHEAVYDHSAHESERSRTLLKVMDCKTAEHSPVIFLGQAEIDSVNAKFSRSGWDPSASWVGFQVGAGTPSKEWPAEHTENLIRQFVSSFPTQRLVLVGADLDAADAMKKMLGRVGAGDRVLNLIGQTRVRELFGIIRQCRAFIGADSGPSHAASVMGVPTLFLYSGTNRYEEWGSQSENAQILRSPVPCSPCHLTHCNVFGHPCMTGIRPDKVAEWLVSVLYKDKNRA